MTKYCKLRGVDIANGEGVRVSLFVSGCRNRCTGCFQPETWDFDYGEDITEGVEQKILRLLDHDYINGITILGGEPFEPENQECLIKLLSRIRKEFPSKDVWCYTGFTIDDIICSNERCCTDRSVDLLKLIDTLVDGKFIEEQKDISLKFRGSANQRIINVKEFLNGIV